MRERIVSCNPRGLVIICGFQGLLYVKYLYTGKIKGTKAERVGGPQIRIDPV
jgi:hypothetical protein